MTVDRTRVEFLCELSDRHHGLLVWKHLDRALRGQGDIDAAAPGEDAATIIADAVRLGPSLLGASHVIRCEHVADKRLLFFVQPDLLPQLFEFDLCTQPSRGLSPWASPAAMGRLTTTRPDGIRSLRPGAEAVVSVVYHGMSRSGRDRLTGDERAIVDRGIADDLEGAYRACGLLAPRPARASLSSLVRELSDGGWSHVAARRAYAAFVGSAVAHPSFLVRRSAFRARLGTGRECVMSRIARLGGRRVPRSGLSHLIDEAELGGHQVVAW